MTAHRATQIDQRRLRDLGYSLRRYFVDDFHFRHVQSIPPQGLVLDLGGHRIGKRGLFDLDLYGFQVVYANLSAAKRPHVQAEAGMLPFPDDRFDTVICSELLEHVPDPVRVVAEIHRVLKPDGIALICVPFNSRIHGDPYDYGRYTDFYWQQTLGRVGFGKIHIEKQGLFWSVLADMLRDLAYEKTGRGALHKPWILRLVSRAVGMVKSKALDWDERLHCEGNSPLLGFTTGFGIRAVKPPG